MNQDFIGEKSQSGVKGKIVGVKKITSRKIKKIEIEEKEYYCFTCEFATNNRKDYKRHLESKKHIKNEENENKEMEARRNRKKKIM